MQEHAGAYSQIKPNWDVHGKRCLIHLPVQGSKQSRNQQGLCPRLLSPCRQKSRATLIQEKCALCAGNSYYSSESNTSTAAGFKQYCVPVPLAPGWHGLELRYSKAPLDRTSVFRFFVVDAEQARITCMSC